MPARALYTLRRVAEHVALAELIEDLRDGADGGIAESRLMRRRRCGSRASWTRDPYPTHKKNTSDIATEAHTGAKRRPLSTMNAHPVAKRNIIAERADLLDAI